MEQSNLITVALPYCQNPDYLRQALLSIFRQSMLPAEVVVVDNSTQGDITTLFADSPIPIRHVRSAAGAGLAAYFNQCLDAAKTPWCTVMHADDIMLPGYIEAMDAAARLHPEASGIFCKTDNIDEAGEEIFYFKDRYKNLLWLGQGSEYILCGAKGLKAILRSNFIMCPTMCYHVGLQRFSPEWKLALDLEFNGRLLLEDGTLIGLNRILYSYRRHLAAASMVNNKELEMLIEAKACVKHLTLEASRRNWRCYSLAGRVVHMLHVTLNLFSRPKLIFSRSFWLAF